MGSSALRAGTALLLVILGVAGSLLREAAAPGVRAQPPWPTPPPAAPWPTPVRVPFSRVTPVPREGGWVRTVQPAVPPPFPIVPPQPSLLLPGRSAEAPVRLRVEPISLPFTLQIRYRPLSPEEVPPLPPGGGRLLGPFRLETFDARGRPVLPSLRRPWLLAVRVPEGVDPGRALLVRYEEGAWRPLLTVWDPHTGELRARILRPGLFAVLEEAAPGRGG